MFNKLIINNWNSRMNNWVKIIDCKLVRQMRSLNVINHN